MKGRLLIALFISAAVPARAARAKGADAGGAGYLKIGMGARAAGMGNAFTSVADDATALYWNPAFLAMASEGPIALDAGSVSLGEGRTLHSLATVVSFDRSTEREDQSLLDAQDALGDDRVHFRPREESKRYSIGAGAISYGVGDIDGRDDFGAALPSFTDKEATYTLGFGLRRYEDALFGVSADYMTQTLAGYKAHGISIGAGFAFMTPQEGWTFSLAGRGLGGKLTWDVMDPVTQKSLSYKEPTQASLSAGVARHFFSKAVTFTAEARKYSKQSIEGHAGLEVNLFRILSLRAGLNAYDPTFGLGLRIPLGGLDLSLQYAYQYDLEDFHSPQWMSLALKF